MEDDLSSRFVVLSVPKPRDQPEGSNAVEQGNNDEFEDLPPLIDTAQRKQFVPLLNNDTSFAPGPRPRANATAREQLITSITNHGIAHEDPASLIAKLEEAVTAGSSNEHSDDSSAIRERFKAIHERYPEFSAFLNKEFSAKSDSVPVEPGNLDVLPCDPEFEDIPPLIDVSQHDHFSKLAKEVYDAVERNKRKFTPATNHATTGSVNEMSGDDHIVRERFKSNNERSEFLPVKLEVIPYDPRAIREQGFPIGKILTAPPRLIGLCGFAGTGKDTVADLLCEHYGFQKVAFADKVYAMALEINYYFPTLKEDYKSLVERLGYETAKGTHQEVRDYLVKIGHSARQVLSPTIWVDSVLPPVNTRPQISRNVLQAIGLDPVLPPFDSTLHVTEFTKPIVISDVSNPTEGNRIRERGGQVWRIHRPNHGPIDHTEGELIANTQCDKTIINDGSFVDLRHYVDEMMKL